MSDLISKQAAIKNAHFPMIDDAGYEIVRVDDILALPSVEPKIKCIVQIRINQDDIEDMVNEIVKSKTGRWVWDDKGYFYCDQCHKYPKYQEATTDFCPNCGSDMRGEEE